MKTKEFFTAMLMIVLSQWNETRAADLVLAELSSTKQTIAGEEYLAGLFSADNGLASFVFSVHRQGYLRYIQFFDGGVAPEIIKNDSKQLPSNLVILGYRQGANLYVNRYFRIEGGDVLPIDGEISSNRSCIFVRGQNMLVSTNDLDPYHQIKESYKIGLRKITLVKRERISAKNVRLLEIPCDEK